MRFVIIILTIFMLIKTNSYGIYELNQKNKVGAICIFILSIFSAFILNYSVIYLR